MTRKRFIKLCMGQLGYSRNAANAAADLAIKNGSYETAYIFLKNEFVSRVTAAVKEATRKLSVFANATAKAITAATSAASKAFREGMRCFNDE